MPQALQRSPDGPAINTIGIPFIELQSVDSTNNYARQQIHAGLARHGQAFFAIEQLAGKGQRGKDWTTEPGADIAMSILIDPQSLRVDQQFQLSACVAVAVHDFFIKYGGDETKIKWPNDLHWQDRKAGGILIESVVKSSDPIAIRSGVGVPSFAKASAGKWEWAIVGIGININQTSFPANLRNPVSLKQITGQHFDPIELAKELCLGFNNRFNELIENGFENIYANYLFHLYKRNEIVKLKKGSKVFEAMIKGVSLRGKLITHHAIEEEFDFGDVKWVIK